ncbi:MAG TPA: HGxxPAAW family protein [Dermatophilaceae bacterium]|nr:HGxxPAAW family protein [Dermatophilaceae bacterium]
MAATEHHDNHGQSVAAWTAVGIILVAAVLMSIAVVWPANLFYLFWVGAVLAVVGVVVGKVLAMAGYGVKKHEDDPLKPGRSQIDSGIK